ncbi:hypothetical protein CGC20_27990 [Leishmania donovani]|uniref:Uncharacterized protein n=1 Tax=Leishmania donovani TaxID=5661 RepID=A0A504WZC4_LEIDO|nr:hypothetical protein CGC20_27990 [Leishmania donovani]
MMGLADSHTPAAVRWDVLPPVSFCDAPDAVGARLFSTLPLLLGHLDYFPEPETRPTLCRSDTRGSGASCLAPLLYRHPRRIPRVTEIPAKNMAEKLCKPHQMPLKPHRCRNVGRQWTRHITRHRSAESSSLHFALGAEATRG